MSEFLTEYDVLKPILGLFKKILPNRKDFFKEIIW